MAVACVAALLALGCLAGCTGKRYSEDDAREVQETGEQIMQAWIATARPRASIESIEYYTFSYPGGPTHLTDFVRGTIRDGDETISFMANTETGEIYLGVDQDELTEATCSYLFEALGYPEPVEASSRYARLLIPSQSPTSKRDVPVDAFAEVMVPANVTDIEEFVRDPENRACLQVGMSVNLPDQDISVWSLERLDQIEGLLNIDFDNVSFYNSTESLNVYNDEAYYTRSAWTDSAGFRLWTTVEHRDESRSNAGAIVTDRNEYNPVNDMVVRLDSKGYTFHYIDQSKKFQVAVYAREGAAALEHSYVAENKETGDKFTVHWEDKGDGLYALVDDGGDTLHFYGDTVLAYAD